MRSIFFSDVNLEPFHCDDLSFLFSTHTSSPLTLSSPLPLLHNPSPHDEDGVGLEVYDMRWVVWNGFFSFVSPSPSFISSALYQYILRLYQPSYYSFYHLTISCLVYFNVSIRRDEFGVYWKWMGEERDCSLIIFPYLISMLRESQMVWIDFGNHHPPLSSSSNWFQILNQHAQSSIQALEKKECVRRLLEMRSKKEDNDQIFLPFHHISKLRAGRAKDDWWW